MRWRIFLISIGLGLGAGPVLAQLGLPQVELPRTGAVLDPVTGRVLGQLDELDGAVVRQARRLADLRIERLERLVRRNQEALAFDARGEPARRGELLLLDASNADLERASALGYAVVDRESIAGLDLALVRLAIPAKLSLAEAETQLAAALPEATVSADNVHFPSGASGALLARGQASSANVATPVGVIDGAPSAAAKVSSLRGFAGGAPFPSNHGTAVVSLLRYAGASDVRVADVYGTDPAGGNALALAKALGWLVENGSRVINVSLVGPSNALVERAVASAQKRGVIIVAAVGNDGPAAPPAYPASYLEVVAVTGVDRSNRVLIEAGRALHLDYAAPGADIYAPNARGKRVRLRGTSFASPLAAVRLAAALEHGSDWRARLDDEARDLGKKGTDATFGRGLLCDACRPQK